MRRLSITSVGVLVALGGLAVALASCSEPDRQKTAATRVEPTRRVIEPWAGTVRPLPPHAIRADGVGPYLLGEKVSALMAQLPSGPRVVRFEIPGVVRTSIIRAEEDTVLIGGETTSTAMFVAVVGAEVARTESNVHVGSSLDDLVRALGAPAIDPDRAYDPRLVVPSSLRNSRVVLDGDRIAAIVVQRLPTRPASREPPPECKRPSSVGKRQFGACLSLNGELIDIEDDELIIHAADSEKAIATYPVRGLVFAAPLRNGHDGRDELVVIRRIDEPHQRTWEIEAFRLDGNRLVRAADREVLYQLSSTQTRWIGAELRDVDLYLEVTSRADHIEVGGLLTTRSGAKVRDVAVILSHEVRRKTHKGAPGDPGDAGLGDAKPATSQGSGTGATGVPE